MKFKLNALCAAVAVSVAAPAVVHANSSLNKLMNNFSTGQPSLRFLQPASYQAQADQQVKR